MTMSIFFQSVIANMATNALSPDALKASLSASQFGRKPSRMTMILFFTILIAGLLFTGYSLKQDVDDMGTVVTTGPRSCCWAWHC